MDINKMIFRGIKIGCILVVVLFIIYGTMKACVVAYDFGYRFAIESLIDTEESTGK